MADEDAPAQFFQAPRRIGRLQIRAGHFVSQGQQHFGDTAHAGAADPDQMDLLGFAKHRCTPQAGCRLLIESIPVSLPRTIRLLPLQETG